MHGCKSQAHMPLFGLGELKIRLDGNSVYNTRVVICLPDLLPSQAKLPLLLSPSKIVPSYLCRREAKTSVLTRLRARVSEDIFRGQEVCGSHVERADRSRRLICSVSRRRSL